MDKYSKKLSLLLAAGVLFVSPISLSYNSDVAHAEDKLDHSQAKVIYLSNQNLFDELEKKVINWKIYLQKKK